MTRAAVIGDACIDRYADGRAYPTGNAVDVAVHLHQLGTQTLLLTAVGGDGDGELVCDALRRSGLGTDHVQVLPGRTAVTQMRLEGTERIHGDYDEGVLAELTFPATDLAVAARCDLVHTAYWGKAERLLDRLRAHGALISFDFADRLGSPLELETRAAVDIGFYSLPTPDTEAIRVLHELHEAGQRCSVATFGDQGSMAYDGKLHVRHADPAPVVNTVGAGDSFIAGFLHTFLAGGSTDEALSTGTRRAAEVVAAFGPFVVAGSDTTTREDSRC